MKFNAKGERIHDIYDTVDECWKENKALRAENGRLRAELDNYNMTAAILAEFRNGNRIMDACFSCGEITEWFRQSTDDGGDNYCTACGYCPVEEETEDIPF